MLSTTSCKKCVRVSSMVSLSKSYQYGVQQNLLIAPTKMSQKIKLKNKELQLGAGQRKAVIGHRAYGAHTLVEFWSA